MENKYLIFIVTVISKLTKVYC